MESIKLYLRDIKTLPLLKADEELALARKVIKGDLKARHEMIKSNLRLVINIAKKYSYLGVPMLDLIEEGNMGLMKAVNKYDPEKGYRFSTYAAWWIKQFITRAVANQGKTVRVPVYVMEMLMRFQKIKKQLTQSGKKIPQLSDIADKLELPLARVKQLNEMASNISSLNAPIGDDGSSEFMDLLEDESSTDALTELNRFLLQERIKKLLDKMDERERRILNLRFGFENGTMHTLRETAEYFGITRERVRQIESHCMDKLREKMEVQDAVAIKRFKDEYRKKAKKALRVEIKIIKKAPKSQKVFTNGTKVKLKVVEKFSKKKYQKV
ncbi:RNA polymerase sigma factor RpoD [Candidatus Omnitrophus magneticus]|uniref:RNA polymerase sigma factor n=1 Tax=Candidatus Omnitrophus magneticus TaxID=1609969 RepID=A0A0F0CJD2_9BACT|nr:RNA polymerase sigma factor RpoD [Candidatus Omnitrophus magneticus]